MKLIVAVFAKLIYIPDNLSSPTCCQSIRTEDSPFILPDKYDYKKCAEVYEFYAYIDTGETSAIDSNQTYLWSA